MPDDTKTTPAKDAPANERRDHADKAATTPGPSDKQGDTPNPGPTEQQPT